MANYSNRFVIGLSLLLALGMCASPALAQNPNLGHFYMARQQVQITDDAPMVNDQRTFPAPGQPGAGGIGAMPRRPLALPRAGFQQYSPAVPGFSSGLPQVVNGVPPKDPPPMPVKEGKRAKTNKLKNSSKSTKTASQKNSPVTAAKAYSPYKGYTPGVTTAQTASGVNDMQSKTRVRGSVLHWARGK